MSEVLPLLIQFLRENKFTRTEATLFEELSELPRAHYESQGVVIPRDDVSDHFLSTHSHIENNPQLFDNIYDNEDKDEETNSEESYDEIDSNCFVIEQDSRIEVKNLMRDMIQTITVDIDHSQNGNVDIDKISDITLDDFDEEEYVVEETHRSVNKRSLSAPIEVMRLDNVKHRELLTDLKRYAEEMKRTKKLHKEQEDKDDNFVDEYEDDDDKGYVRVSVKSTHEIYVQASSLEDYPDQQLDDSEGYASSDSDELNYSDVFSDSEEEVEDVIETEHAEDDKDVSNDVESLLEEISSQLMIDNNLTPEDIENTSQASDNQSEELKTKELESKTEVNIKENDDNGTDDDYTDSEKQSKEVNIRAGPAYETLYLPIVYETNKTGFEESKDFPIMIDSVIAGRYVVQEYLGSAAFSRAIQCLDLVTKQLVCIKIIKNNKDFFDQSLDEIKLLRFINANGDADKFNVVQLYDFFYHREHLFLVCELLRDNLYEFSKFNRENEEEFYFTIPRLQRISRQVLEGLAFIHSLGLIHCDLKPENILMRSYSRCLVKIIDFGSSCFLTDQLCSYVQSRTYRAPEVVLGLKYDQKVDVWSLGCILAELWTGRVLFANKSIQAMLARVIGMCGEFPQDMLIRGQFSPNFFTRNNHLYEKNRKTGKITFLVPKKTRLEARLKSDDPLFVDFVRQCLQIDPRKRPSVEQLLQHPWILCKDYPRVVPEELDDCT